MELKNYFGTLEVKESHEKENGYIANLFINEGDQKASIQLDENDISKLIDKLESLLQSK